MLPLISSEYCYVLLTFHVLYDSNETNKPIVKLWIFLSFFRGGGIGRYLYIGLCWSEIRLHVLCSLILIYTIRKRPLSWAAPGSPRVTPLWHFLPNIRWTINQVLSVTFDRFDPLILLYSGVFWSWSRQIVNEIPAKRDDSLASKCLVLLQKEAKCICVIQRHQARNHLVSDPLK